MSKLLIGVLTLSSITAHAQLIDSKVSTKVKDGQCVIYITENVTASLIPDFQKAMSALENEQCDEKIVDLNNFGGLGKVALKVGEMIRVNSFKTQVLSGNHCSSACGLLFIAGTERALEIKRHYPQPKIGFHSPRSTETNICNNIEEVNRNRSSEIVFNAISKYSSTMLDRKGSLAFLSLMFHTDCSTMSYAIPEKLVEHNVATKIGKFTL